jgi:hypothetical protein
MGIMKKLESEKISKLEEFVQSPAGVFLFSVITGAIVGTFVGEGGTAGGMAIGMVVGLIYAGYEEVRRNGFSGWTNR